MPLTLLLARRKRRKRHRSQKLPSTSAFLLMQREPGKKISEKKGERPRVSWPLALRAVRGWLEPWIMLRRYWRAWSEQPPPGPLQCLLDHLGQGQQIFLYSSG